MTAVEKMSERERERERLRFGDKRRVGGKLRCRSLWRAEGVMACLFLCAQANVATAAVRGGDGEENS